MFLKPGRARGDVAAMMACPIDKDIASRLTLAHLESSQSEAVGKWLNFVAAAFQGETVSSSTVCYYDDFDYQVSVDDNKPEEGDIFHQRWRRDPASSPKVAFLALIDSDRIVASIRYFPRYIYVNVRHQTRIISPHLGAKFESLSGRSGFMWLHWRRSNQRRVSAQRNCDKVTPLVYIGDGAGAYCSELPSHGSPGASLREIGMV